MVFRNSTEHDGGEGSLGERWRRRAGRSPVLKQWRPKDGVGLVVATMGIGDLSA